MIARRLPHHRTLRARGRSTGRVGLLVALAAALVLAGTPGPAQAGTDTIKRSVGNVLFGPVDLLLSPAVAGKTVYRNIRTIEDTTAVRVVYALPGWGFLTVVQAGAGMLRLMIGLMEFVPGLGLIPFDAELEPLFDPVEKSEALVDYDTPVLRFKFGVDYSGSAVY